VQAGIEALQKGEDAAGEAAFRRALKIWPGMADAYAGLGTVYGRLGQFRESVALWQEAVARDTTLVVPLHWACGMWEDEIQARLKTQPATARDYNDLGDTYAIRDSLEGAIYWYRKALDADPDHALSQRNLALTYAGAGRIQEAEAELAHYRRVVQNQAEVQKLEALIRERRTTR
jgi:tetratricopeptide (TPR) repeat protein